MKPKQLVFATGAYGPPNVIPLPGIETFAGEHYHSSSYATGEPYAGKHCIVVGSNSSAHDIAADLWEYGAKVTMLQRSPTTVVRSETLMELGFEPLYSENAVKAGITTDKADLIFAATPFRIMHRGQIPVYQEVRRRDAAFYAKLAKSGFQVDFGEDESGLMMKAMRTGSGYYIDVGASALVARGDIAVRSGLEISRVKERSVELTDGSELPADAHRHGHRLPVDEPRPGADHLGGSRGQGRQVLGTRLGRAERPGSVGRRAAQHVEADAAAGSVVPRRQPPPLPPFLARPRASNQGADGVPSDARLRAAARSSHALRIRFVAARAERG